MCGCNVVQKIKESYYFSLLHKLLWVSSFIFHDFQSFLLLLSFPFGLVFHYFVLFPRNSCTRFCHVVFVCFALNLSFSNTLVCSASILSVFGRFNMALRIFWTYWPIGSSWGNIQACLWWGSKQPLHHLFYVVCYEKVPYVNLMCSLWAWCSTIFCQQW